MINTAKTLLDHATVCNSALKTNSKWAIQKTAEATDDLMGNKIANRNTKVSKNLQQDH